MTEIKSSWESNAAEWIKVIETNQITSRKYTNKAIVDVLKESKAEKIVDIGCGEGWLTREILLMNKNAIGLDATIELIKNAQNKGVGNFYQFSYEEIIASKPIPDAPFDAAIFNFCLYLNEELISLLKATKRSLVPNGEIIIQTLHPYFLIQNQLDYKSQWIKDSWKGLAGNFKDGHQWYARTFEDWIKVFNNSGLILTNLMEVKNEVSVPISVIFKVTNNENL